MNDFEDNQIDLHTHPEDISFAVIPENPENVEAQTNTVVVEPTMPENRRKRKSREGGDGSLSISGSEEEDEKAPSLPPSLPASVRSIRGSNAGTPQTFRTAAVSALVAYGADDEIVSSSDDDEVDDDAATATRNDSMIDLHDTGADSDRMDVVNEEDSSENEHPDEEKVDLSKYDITAEVATPPAAAVQPTICMDSSIDLPPAPKARCSRALEEKIAKYHKMVTEQGFNITDMIENRKDFRNPSIYEKLIEHCNINEKGTNFTPDVFDPHIWGPESFYDHLAKVQMEEMERREKERKERTKIDFTGPAAAKKPAGGESLPAADKKKTKWDSAPSSQGSVPERKDAIIPPANIIHVTRTAGSGSVVPSQGGAGLEALRVAVEQKKALAARTAAALTQKRPANAS